MQSTLKEINPENPPEGLMLRQKLQNYCYLIWRANSLEKTLMLERLEQQKGMIEDQMFGCHHQPNGFEFEQTGRCWRTAMHDMLQSVGLWRVGDDWAIEQQITTSNNKATECIWPWIDSGTLVPCHRSENQDSGKTLNVFDWELVK